MKDREIKYTDDLRRCRENIAKTKALIEYHKDMLKKLERKEMQLVSKLEKVKMSSLYEMISKGGYDIDTIRSAVKAGDFSTIASEASENEKTDTPNDTAEDIGAGSGTEPAEENATVVSDDETAERNDEDDNQS